jgi:hypothetical protein
LIVPLVEDVIRAQHRELEEVLRANGVKVALGRSNIRMMRLVQPLPPEVEALARRRLAGDGEPDEEMEPPAREAPSEADRETDADVAPAVDQEPPNRSRGAQTTVFDQRGQTVYGPQTNVAGDYRSQPAAQGANWNTAAVRDLLTAAFSDGELTTLCFDYFHPVYEDFSSGMGKGDKIQRLLEHCLRHGQMDELLARVQQRNPAQYRRFAERLGR